MFPSLSVQVYPFQTFQIQNKNNKCIFIWDYFSKYQITFEVCNDYNSR